jgi:hypothetical protein
MKRIHVTLTRIDGNEMLKITHPLFVGIVADRFVIEDQRGPRPKKPAKVKENPTE